MTIRLLGISGSLRRDSYNHALLRAAARLAPEGVDLVVHEGLKDVPVFDEDRESDPPHGVRALRAAVQGADGVLLATPEYNQSIPGSMKNVIDWLSRSDHLEGKPVAVVGATSGPWGTRIAQSQLRQILLAVGAPVLPAPTLFVPRADEVFDAGGELVDGETLRRLAGIVSALVDWTSLHGSATVRQPSRLELSGPVS
ncbi:NADPH-dependent FMN reductase [Intrasporangium sp.]|uniref:NADPH-dependent FMN reductase n=1 Tax=Intrasporangium sp. TaxID=1925024 RepID=UPI00293B6241|nr:NADPH-dependent FMN reductase [Intrasporangium sp.]MDV3222692.1 NAD(P)H-dependent oxidoreductase [Intrasporangium sp.]